MAKRKLPSKAKSREMLMDGTVHGKKLTKKQKGLFGLIAGGGTPTKAKKKPRKKKGY